MVVNKDFGWIENLKGTKKVPIKVKFPDRLDTSILIGIGLVEVGMIFLGSRNIAKLIVSSIVVNTGVAFTLYEMFYKGANQFMKAETEAQIELGILDGKPEDYIF